MNISVLANELLLHILQSCATVPSLLALAATNRHFHSILASHRLPLLYSAAEVQFGPLSDAIRLVTHNTSQAAHLPRPAPPQSLALLERLVKVGQVAEKWVNAYPSLKWRGEASKHRRLLTAQEAWNLRRACYRIWLYSLTFHTPQYLRTNRLQPQVVRTRAMLLRPWPGYQLAEILDLHAIFRQLLHSHICPSNGTVLKRHKQRFPDDPFPLISTTSYVKYRQDDQHVNFHQAYFHSTPHVSRLPMANPHNAAIEGWGDEIAQYYVVEDMLKLDPGQLMFIFESVTGRADLDSSDFGLGHGSKGLVEAYIASLGDWFENNGETLVETIGFVVGERGGDFDETRELVEDGWEGIARKGRGGG